MGVLEGFVANKQHCPLGRKDCKDCRRAGDLWTNYRIKLEEWTALAAYQAYRCYICGTPLDMEVNGRTRLATDHDHNNKRVRGILCLNCNTQLAWFERNQENIFSYLATPPFQKLIDSKKELALLS